MATYMLILCTLCGQLGVLVHELLVHRLKLLMLLPDVTMPLWVIWRRPGGWKTCCALQAGNLIRLYVKKCDCMHSTNDRPKDMRLAVLLVV